MKYWVHLRLRPAPPAAGNHKTPTRYAPPRRHAVTPPRRHTATTRSFPDAPPRVSRPEAQGLRRHRHHHHLAFRVRDLDEACAALRVKGVNASLVEPVVRVDEFTGRRFAFLADPDDLPLELYES